MNLPRRLLPALMVAGLGLASGQGAAAQSLNDLANQFLRPQQPAPDRDAIARDAYERGRADAAREGRDQGDYRGPDDRRFQGEDRRRGDEERRRRFEEEQRRRAEYDRDRPDQGRAPQPYGR